MKKSCLKLKFYKIIVQELHCNLTIKFKYLQNNIQLTKVIRKYILKQVNPTQSTQVNHNIHFLKI